MASKQKDRSKGKSPASLAEMARAVAEMRRKQDKLQSSLERMEKREKALQRELDRLREELQASETTVLAAELRDANDRRIRDGAPSVKETLKRLREKGLVDGNGRRVSPSLPAEMTQNRSSVV